MNLLKRNIVPMLFWGGVSLIAGHYFGIVGVGVVLIITALISVF